MKKLKMILGMIVVSLGLNSSAWGEGWWLGEYLTDTNDLEAPSLDVWSVKCTSVTTIKAATWLDIVYGLENLHVTALCIDPRTRLGKGDSEIAQLPERPGSGWAEVSGCKEALIEVQCDYHTPCTGSYAVVVDCANAHFADRLNGKPAPILRLNR